MCIRDSSQVVQAFCLMDALAVEAMCKAIRHSFIVFLQRCRKETVITLISVSYTHLDVYKRQDVERLMHFDGIVKNRLKIKSTKMCIRDSPWDDSREIIRNPNHRPTFSSWNPDR